MKAIIKIRVSLYHIQSNILTQDLQQAFPDEEYYNPSLAMPNSFVIEQAEGDPLLKQAYDICVKNGLIANHNHAIKDADEAETFEYNRVLKFDKSDFEKAELLELRPLKWYRGEKAEVDAEGCVVLEKRSAGKFKYIQHVPGRKEDIVLVSSNIRSAIEQASLKGIVFKPVFLKSKNNVEKSEDIFQITSQKKLSTFCQHENPETITVQRQASREEFDSNKDFDVLIGDRMCSTNAIIVSQRFYQLWDKNKFRELGWDPVVLVN